MEKSKNTKNEVIIPEPFTIGIICNGNNYNDISYYLNEFRIINRLFKDRVRLLLIGIESSVSDPDILPGVEYTYTRPVSMEHYFKHSHALKMDLLFIPLIKTEYNASSENYNKFLEASLFGVPIITVKICPYSLIIKNRENGFLYESKETFIDELKDILVNNLSLIKITGQSALETTLKNFSYNNENVIELINAFS